MRRGSFHTALLHALAKKVSPAARFEIAPALDRLPHFNPDLDAKQIRPDAVMEWRRVLEKADAVFFAVPEYAHAIPGTFKNALDWVVGSGELIYKPVGVINGSPNGTGAGHVHAALRHTLELMTANVIPDACLNIAAISAAIDLKSRTVSPGLDADLARVANAMIEAVKHRDPNELRVLHEWSERRDNS